jgi:hypothetical protein
MRIIQESSLSRILTHMLSHDCGTISAFRGEYSLKVNLQRSHNLMAKLLSLDYGVTEINGVYIENFGESDAKEVKEKAFFVVDLKDKGHLEKDLRHLGEKFDQDSILFIPKPGDESYLWGTNHVSEFPGYGKFEHFAHRGMGSSGQFMTKIRNKPFVYESVSREISNPNGYLGKWAVSTEANRDTY